MPVRRLPEWMKVRVTFDEQYRRTLSTIHEYNLHTVCQEAGCPNRGACFAEGTATFLILGDVCTRFCRFCGIGKGVISPPDLAEPERVAEAVRRLKLDYAVITSVTRDDLLDGGAGYFAEVIKRIRQACPQTAVEVLTPDFGGNEEALQIVADAGPDVFNHNVETVPRLYKEVRPQADYTRSLNVLAKMKGILPKGKTKSGLMVGLGETMEEIAGVLQDLRKIRCDLVTIGQYLAPSEEHIPVAEFVTPDKFAAYEKMAKKMGFAGVAAGPLVRSSYHAKIMHESSKDKKDN